MTTLTEPLIFQHNPLQDARTHIRLLKVLSVVDTRAFSVHCELTTFSITEAPPYRAISYTWGNPTPLTSILVNGRHMNVRSNCEDALRQASQHDGSETGDCLIWIDSICVNQLDIDEKGAQVAMMGEIFKRASRVLACVGAHEDDSRFLYEFLRGEEERFRSLLLSKESVFREGRSLYRSNLIGSEATAWTRKHPASIIIRLCTAVANFLARQYFHRVWIYQELFLGRDISVYCGGERLPLSWIWMTCAIIRSWLTRAIGFWLCLRFRYSGITTRLWYNLKGTMPLLLAGATEQPLMLVSKAIAEVAALSCQDPRDRIYGIISITIPFESNQFQPDYTKDRLDLAVDVLQKTRAQKVVGDSDNERLVSYARGVGLNLNLKNEPSRKLISAVQLRHSSTNLEEMEPNMVDTRDETSGSNWWLFIGCRILSKQGKWGFQHQDEWFPRHSLLSEPPRMEKWLQSNKVPKTSVGVHLPPEAQDGDWLLISDSIAWLGKKSSSWSTCRFAFLARNYDSEKFEIVGKVLISRWMSKWVKTFEKGASNFRVHCDPEDILVLFHLCNWNYLRDIKNWHDPEFLDAYFRTRFCGKRFSSYAVLQSVRFRVWDRIPTNLSSSGAVHLTPNAGLDTTHNYG